MRARGRFGTTTPMASSQSSTASARADTSLSGTEISTTVSSLSLTGRP
ncbi:hypothetical protein [Kutzneria chonburiensis]|nr:hypothetical protein [Kutzneria chonburiensis]